MNDGFYWFIAFVAAFGFAGGLIVGGAVRPRTCALLACVTVVAGIVALFKFIYTPVRGVEDDQEMK